MIVTTTNTVEGRKIAEYYGLVFGEVVEMLNASASSGASLRSWIGIGGRTGGYEKTLVDARNSALNEMCGDAYNMGADAIVGVTVNYSAHGEDNDSTVLMVTATGTAVRLA